jgi:membrane protein implicated in regulation of membrane protease activity
VTSRLEGVRLWLVVAAGATAGAIVFLMRDEWLGFALFAVATSLAVLQLARIFMRGRGGGGTGRRY